MEVVEWEKVFLVENASWLMRHAMEPASLINFLWICLRKNGAEVENFCGEFFSLFSAL